MKVFNNIIRYKLNNEEINLLSYEFSKEKMLLTLIEYQTAFNNIYKKLISIFRKIFNMKHNNNMKNDLNNYIKDLGVIEQELLKKYKTILFYVKLSKLDLKNTDIYLEFSSQEEKSNFFKNLLKRKTLLEEYNKQMNELEFIKNRIYSIYNKIICMNSLDIYNK